MSRYNHTKTDMGKKSGVLRKIGVHIGRVLGPKALSRDLFQSFGFGANILKEEVEQTKEFLRKEKRLISKKNDYQSFEGMLMHHNISLQDLIAIYRRYYIACFILVFAVIYLGYVLFDSTNIATEAIAGILSFCSMLYYVKYRMWMFMVEKRRFVKIRDWMHAMWIFPMRFFPVAPRNVFKEE